MNELPLEEVLKAIDRLESDSMEQVTNTINDDQKVVLLSLG